MEIFLLHRHRYWTEYLEYLLGNQKIFRMVRSRDADPMEYPNLDLPLFNSSQHRIVLTSGLFDDPTKGNFIIFRSQHSPGFYVIPHIIGYKGFSQYHSKSDFRMTLLESHYRALMLREFDHPELDAIRYEMISDPRVSTMSVDLSMYRMKDAPVTRKRVKGTGLVCMRWLAQYVDVKKIQAILQELSKELKCQMVIHPCTKFTHWIKAIQELEGSCVEKVHVNLPRRELIGLLDASEFVITDGSGTCYEGLIRGCKPLAIHHLYEDVEAGDMAMEMVYDTLEEEFFPFRSYKELALYQDGEDDGFIDTMYPFLNSVSFEEAKKMTEREIVESCSSLLH